MKKKSGAHCHIKEKEFLILIQGSCTGVINYGYGLEKIEMEGPTDALYVGEKVWHHFKNFSDDAILLALSSTNYDPTRSGYVEDYEKYTKEILKQ